MEAIKLNNHSIVVIDYAHTPDAYEKVFRTLKLLKSQNAKIYTVFGAGGDRHKKKRPKISIRLIYKLTNKSSKYFSIRT